MQNSKGVRALRLALGFSDIVPGTAHQHPVRGSMHFSHLTAARLTVGSTLGFLRTEAGSVLDDSLGVDPHSHLPRQIIKVIRRYSLTSAGNRVEIGKCIIYKTPDGKAGAYEYQTEWNGINGQAPTDIVKDVELKPGNIIPPDRVWQKPLRLQEDTLGLGVMNLTVFTDFLTDEDGLCVSEPLCDDWRLQHTLNQHLRIVLTSKTSTLRSLDEKEDRPILKVGDQVPLTRIAARVYNVDGNQSAESPLAPASNDTIYTASYPRGVVTDVRVVLPGNLKNDRLKAFLSPLYREECLYYNAIKEVADSFGEFIHDNLYLIALQGVYITNPTINKEARRARIGAGMIEYTIKSLEKPGHSTKWAGDAGDKATLTTKTKDEQTPRDEWGRRIDMLHSSLSTVNRINPQRMHVHELHGGVLTLSHRLKQLAKLHPIDGVGDLQSAYSVLNNLEHSVYVNMLAQLKEFYTVMLPETFDYLTPETEKDDWDEILARYLLNERLQMDGELWAYYDNTKSRDIHYCMNWLHNVFKIEKHHLTINGVKSKRKFVVGGYWMVLINRHPYVDKGVSTQAHSPSGAAVEDSHAPYLAKGMRVGELEIMAIQSNTPKGTVEKILRSASLEGERMCAEQIMEHGQNCLMDINLDGAPAPLDSFIQTYFALQGLELHRTFNDNYDDETNELLYAIANPDY